MLHYYVYAMLYPLYIFVYAESENAIGGRRLGLW